MRVCTRAGLEKYQADRSADAGNSPRSNGKLGKEKCYVSSCGIFFRRQISFCVISGTFLWRKLFCNHSRILFVRLSWCLIEWTARTDTIPLVHLHFAAFFFSRVALSNGHEQFLFLSWAKSYDTRKKYSIAIKALANYFFVERSRIEKKSCPGLFSLLIRNARLFYSLNALKALDSIAKFDTFVRFSPLAREIKEQKWF